MCHRFTFRTFAALALGALSSSAQAEVAGIDKVRIGSEADFGSGVHANGSPDSGTVTWDYTPVSGVVSVTARVQGTLYLDRRGPGRARLTVAFQDVAGNDLTSRHTVEFDGPGINANDPLNQRPVDVSFASPLLARVQLFVSSGPTGGPVAFETGFSKRSPAVDSHGIINSRTADFGGRPAAHSSGAPVNSYDISMRLVNGRIEGNVEGVLYWDSTSAGTARLIIEFKDAAGNNLAFRTINESAPAGGGATSGVNHTFVNETFTSASLFQILLRVGSLSGGSLVNVTTRTHGFGPALGFVVGDPENAFVRVGERDTYGVLWTVPEPDNWHSLDLIDLRLRDQRGTAIHLRWDEAENTFRELDLRTGEFSSPAQPGGSAVFQSPAVTLFLSDTEVIGSGPAGPSVLLNLSGRFKRQAAGRTFAVEARARDDSGQVQEWDLAGTITVLRRDHRGN